MLVEAWPPGALPLGEGGRASQKAAAAGVLAVWGLALQGFAAPSVASLSGQPVAQVQMVTRTVALGCRSAAYAQSAAGACCDRQEWAAAPEWSGPGALCAVAEVSAARVATRPGGMRAAGDVRALCAVAGCAACCQGWLWIVLCTLGLR